MTEEHEHICPLDIGFLAADPELVAEIFKSRGEDPDIYRKRLDPHYSEKGGHKARSDYHAQTAKDMRILRRRRARR